MKRDLVLALVVIVVVAGICFGLAQMRPNFTPTPSHPYTLDETVSPIGTPVPAAPAQRYGKVVMHVNGEPVTDEEFQMYVSGMPEQMQQMAQMPAGRRALADQIASLIALAQEGRKMGLQSEKDTQMRMSAEQTNLLATAALHKLVAPSDAALRAEYEKQKSNFDSVDLKHIVIAYEGGQIPPREGQKPLPLQGALQKAAQIEAQLKSGADFATLAKTESDDVASGQRGGDLGPVSRQALPPEIGGVVFALKTGEISQPVRTQFGVHIFKAGARTSPPFDDEMKSRLQAEMEQKTARETVERVKNGAKIDLDPAFFGPPTLSKSPKNPS